MTPDYESPPKDEGKKMDMLGGIYRVLQAIDDKVDEILEEIRHTPDSDHEDYLEDPYWYNPEGNGYY
jgi:methyl coenzyme M reductase subunit C